MVVVAPAGTSAGSESIGLSSTQISSIRWRSVQVKMVLALLVQVKPSSARGA